MVFVYLRMSGITRALGRGAYLSVWREERALCLERLAVFVPSLPLPRLSTEERAENNGRSPDNVRPD